MRGRVLWNGARWRWQEPGTSAAVELPGWRPALDLGGWLLLRDDAGRWCGLAAGDDPARWHGLRVALHSIAGAELRRRRP
jgi:hypothetical protein